jgi:Methyltransferase domain
MGRHSRRVRVATLVFTAAIVVLNGVALGFTASWTAATTTIAAGAVIVIVIKVIFELSSKTNALRSDLRTSGDHTDKRFREAKHDVTRQLAFDDAITKRVRTIEQHITRQLAFNDAMTDRVRTAEQHALATEHASASRFASVDAVDDAVGRINDRVSSLARQFDLDRRNRIRAVACSDTSGSVQQAIQITEIARIIEAVDSGDIPPEHTSDDFPEEVIGLSGRKFRTLICELVRLFGARGHYLEIGTYHGKTICTSCVNNPDVVHLGIDNFSQFDRDGMNHAILNRLIARLGIDNIDFRDEDFETFMRERTRTNTRDVSVFYFDASHDYRSQLFALLHGARQVVDGGVMLVDDCNYTHVRAATYDFCESHPDWALLFEHYTGGHPMKAEAAKRRELDEGWWNGVNVLVHDPSRMVERLERVPESNARSFFLAQHPMENCDSSAVRSRSASVS